MATGRLLHRDGMGVIGTKSAMLLLREAFYGTTRFEGFARRAGIAEAVAVARLKDLVAAAVFEKRPYREAGKRTRHEYVLTDKGRALLPVIIALMQWGDTYLQDDGGPLRVVSPETGEPVQVAIRPADAESYLPEKLAVRINQRDVAAVEA